MQNKKIFSRKFLSIILVFLIGVGGLYFYFNQLKSIQTWQTHGKAHYQLLTEVDQLGGIDVIIARIQERLKNNPDDIQGWIILSKIFISLHRYGDAKKTLHQAELLQPGNEEVGKLRGQLNY